MEFWMLVNRSETNCLYLGLLKCSSCKTTKITHCTITRCNSPFKLHGQNSAQSHVLPWNGITISSYLGTHLWRAPGSAVLAVPRLSEEEVHQDIHPWALPRRAWTEWSGGRQTISEYFPLQVEIKAIEWSLNWNFSHYHFRRKSSTFFSSNLSTLRKRFSMNIR